MRLKALAALLTLAAALVVAGVATWTIGGALVVAGATLAGLAWLFLGEVE